MTVRQVLRGSNNSCCSIAYLGPEGSYSAIALDQIVKPCRGVACSSISSAFSHLINSQVDLALVPIENLVQGPVTETLDQLRQYSDTIVIASSFNQHIRHALAVNPLPEEKTSVISKSDPGSINEIYSHPQALHQCSKFLDRHFPCAERIPVKSTSYAFELVRERQLGNIAAIGSEEHIPKYGLKTYATNISNLANNQTRFILIRRAGSNLDASDLLPVNLFEINPWITSLVINPGRDRQGLLFEMLSVISVKHSINLVSIHSRPDQHGGFVFFLDLEGKTDDQAVRSCIEDLKTYCLESTGEVASISIFGSYPSPPFHKKLFSTVGIVGGMGKMGVWFKEFFEQAGLSVIISDLDSGLTLNQVVSASDVVLLSVPISVIENVAREMAPHLKPGQLVVENCSIKTPSLPHLTECFPEHVEILGFHTMFGNNIEYLKGENIVVTKTERSGEIAQAFVDIFYKYGARIHYADICEHDKATAVTQSLVHFALVCLSEVLANEFPNLEELEAFHTPNSRELLTAIKRITSQKDALLDDLQVKNPYASVLRRRLLESVFNLSAKIENQAPQALSNTAKQFRKIYET